MNFNLTIFLTQTVSILVQYSIFHYNFGVLYTHACAHVKGRKFFSPSRLVSLLFLSCNRNRLHHVGHLHARCLCTRHLFLHSPLALFHLRVYVHKGRERKKLFHHPFFPLYCSLYIPRSPFSLTLSHSCVEESRERREERENNMFLVRSLIKRKLIEAD